MGEPCEGKPKELPPETGVLVMRHMITCLESTIRDAVKTDQANPPLPGMPPDPSVSKLYSELADAHARLAEYQGQLNSRN